MICHSTPEAMMALDINTCTTEELRQEVVRLRMANMRLRERIAHVSNYDVAEIGDLIDAALADWTRRMKADNRTILAVDQP
jgi:hypothetical protein